MKREDIHRAWAPANGPWSKWVKPLLFASLEDRAEPAPLAPAPEWLFSRVLSPLESALVRDDAHPYREHDGLAATSFVVDLPSALGVEVGVALATRGIRPVPLYNALSSQSSVALVDVRPLMTALVAAAPLLAALPDGAPPAFLLDARRMGKPWSAQPGLFDNRSICNTTDFPSAELLWASGIRRAVVLADSIASDLEPTLVSWQHQGIELWRKATTDDQDIAPFTLKPRPWPLRLLHAARWTFASRDLNGSYGTFIKPSAG